MRARTAIQPVHLTCLPPALGAPAALKRFLAKAEDETFIRRWNGQRQPLPSGSDLDRQSSQNAREGPAALRLDPGHVFRCGRHRPCHCVFQVLSRSVQNTPAATSLMNRYASKFAVEGAGPRSRLIKLAAVVE